VVIGLFWMGHQWILIAVFGALMDRFGPPRVEQELVGQEEVEKTIDPAG
jgi:hypothetical protein